jgi:hypothetical protein
MIIGFIYVGLALYRYFTVMRHINNHEFSINKKGMWVVGLSVFLLGLAFFAVGCRVDLLLVLWFYQVEMGFMQ